MKVNVKVEMKVRAKVEIKVSMASFQMLGEVEHMSIF